MNFPFSRAIIGEQCCFKLLFCCAKEQTHIEIVKLLGNRHGRCFNSMFLFGFKGSHLSLWRWTAAVPASVVPFVSIANSTELDDEASPSDWWKMVSCFIWKLPHDLMTLKTKVKNGFRIGKSPTKKTLFDPTVEAGKWCYFTRIH